MTTYSVTDGNGEIEIEAESAQAACWEWVDTGDWGSEAKTTWVSCRATEVIEPRYDASGVTGASFLRDMQAAPDSNFPEIDISDLSASDRDALCSYLRADDGSLSEGDQEYCGEIADEIEALDAPEPESESHTIKIPPTEPDCCAGSHDWASPLSVVGGIKENPGVYGNGGGVVITEVCRHCGRYQITDTWAQNPENGEQGLTSVEFRDSDESSEAWLTRRYDAAEEYVREHSDEDDMSGDDLERHFANYFHRPVDDEDRKNGLWSLLCQAVGVEEKAAE
jgi:hypothetical protein